MCENEGQHHFNAGANGLCVYADTSRPQDGTRALCRPLRCLEEPDGTELLAAAIRTQDIAV